MKNRMLSLVLAILIIVTCVPTPTYAVDVSEMHPQQHPMIGELVAISPSTSVYYHAPGGSYSFINIIYFADCMEIVDVDETTSTTYYQLNAAPNFSWKADSLGHVELYDGIWVKASDTIHLVYCEDCEEYNCGKDHSTTEPTTPITPPVVDGGVAGYVTDSEGDIVTDANGEPLIITVTGDLPEGAIVSASIPEINGEKLPNVFNIKVLAPNEDGVMTEWQPIDEGKTVTLSIPLDTGSEYVDVYHYIDYKAAINGNVEYLPVAVADSEVVDFFASEIAASDKAGYIAVRKYQRILVSNNTVAINTDSFSVYSWNETNKEFDLEDAKGTVSVPNGFWNGSTDRYFELYATPKTEFEFKTDNPVWGGNKNSPFELNESETTVDIKTVELVNNDDGSYILNSQTASIVIPETAAAGEVIVINFNGMYSGKISITIVREVNVSFASPSISVESLPAPQKVVTDGDETKNIFSLTPVGIYVPTPTDSHYEFKGWNTSPDGTGTPYNYDKASNTFSPNAFTPMRDMTLYAMWESENCIVKFNPNKGAGTYEDVIVKTGDTITLPEGPQRTDYVFLGWSASSDGYSTPYAAGASYTVNQDTTLYAIWGVDLTINVSGGTELLLQKEGDFEAKPLQEHMYTNGQPVFIYEPETINGVTTYRTVLLEGFLKNARFTFKYSSTYKTNEPAATGAQVKFTKQTNQVLADITEAGINVNTTISFAAVPQGQKSFIVSYNTNYGTPIASTILQGLENDKLTLNALPAKEDTTRTGYTLEGWYLDEALTQKAVVPMNVTANITLYAKWTPNSYTAKWVVDGTVVEEKTYNYGTQLVKPVDPAKAGYSFNGWAGYTDGTTMPAGDITFTAQWKEQYSYKLVFDANTPAGATATVNGMPLTQSQGWCDDATKTFTWAETPTLTNYKFLGWSTNPSATTGNTAKTFTITGVGASEATVTLYAIWELDVATYTIEIYTEKTDASGYEMPISYPMTSTIGTDVTVNPSQYPITGFRFNDEKSTTSGKVNAEGTLVLKLYFDRNRYAVTYNANGGESAPAGQTKVYGVDLILTSDKPSRTGYTFLGWATTSDATEVEFAAGATCTANETLTLYAKWTLNYIALTIATNKDAANIDTDQTYIFTVKGTGVDGSEIELTVALGARDHQKIVNLPAGTYTITNHGAWSWRYAAKSAQQVIYSGEAEVVFSYAYTDMIQNKIYWINNYSEKKRLYEIAEDDESAEEND